MQSRHPGDVVAAAERPSARDDRDWYTPTPLPAEVADLVAVGGHDGRGRLGKVGLLELEMARVAGVTRAVHLYQRTPLHFFRPIYVDTRRPDMAFCYVLQSGEGLVDGDRYRIDVRAGAGAAVHVTSQAATKIFRTPTDVATQLVHLVAGPGAVLEYLPDPVIPFAGSRFYGRTEVVVDPDATVIVGETLLPGRVARGEAHAYELYWSELQARRPDGRLLFLDTLRLAPTGGGGPPIQLGPYHVHAALHVLSHEVPAGELSDVLDAAVRQRDGVLGGASELPAGAGVAVRILGQTSAAVTAAVRAAWNAARLTLLGVPAPDLRKG